MDVHRLKESMAQAAAFGDELPLQFYSQLFYDHPWTRDLFPVGMAAQRDRLAGALVRIVGAVDELDDLVPYLEQLGADHRKYGDFRPEHYQAVGAALLKTLAYLLGPAWTPELEQDWTAAYGVVSQVMLKAADDAAATEPPWWEAEVVAHDRPTVGIAVLTLRPAQPLSYRPGQAVSLEHPGAAKVWRYYSVANAPRADHSIDLHVRAVDGGLVSGLLVYGTGKGDVVRLGSAVGGGLSLTPGATSDVLMLAGGTGLAPLYALIEELALLGQRRHVYLYIGGYDDQDLYGLAHLQTLEQRWPWLHVTPVITDPDAIRIGGLSAQIPSGALADVALSRTTWTHAEVVVCGSPRMVAYSIDTLTNAGVDRAWIRSETFTYDRHTRGKHLGGGTE